MVAQQVRSRASPAHETHWTSTHTGVAQSSRNSRQPGASLTSAPYADGIERALATYGEDVAKATAVQGFQHIAKDWQLTDQEAAGLLNLPAATWESGEWVDAISREQVLRAVLIIGIYRALHQYFGEHLANSWVRRQNSDPLFDGQTPTQLMIHGGVPVMKQTLDYVDGMRGRV